MEEFITMEERITDQLKKLFDDWIKEQEKEKGYECKLEKTGIAKDSFTPDGIVDEEIWNQLNRENKKKVLYLLREANGNTSTLNENGKSVDDGRFWFQQCVEDGNIGNIIFKRIVEMQKIIQDDKSDKSDKEILKQVAYMNINKRGGGSTVDWKILNDYAKEYRKNIMEEICIIKPDIIVCCGTYWPFVDNICHFYKDEGGKKWNPGDKEDFVLKAKINDEYECTIINMYHPSARMAKETYIERFRQLWECDKNKEKVANDSNVLKKDEIIQVIRDLDDRSEQYYDLCELIRSIKETKDNV